MNIIPFELHLKLLKSLRRWQPRLLRTYERVADREHDCATDNCAYITILPGDRYHAEVWAMNGRIVVKKLHDFCPPIDDPEDWGEKTAPKRQHHHKLAA